MKTKKRYSRKILSFILSFILLATTLPFSAITSFAGGVWVERLDDWDVEIMGDEINIFAYYGTETDLVIPEEIEGYRVTEITNLSSKTQLTSLVIPSSVTYIWGYPLHQPKLSKITLPDTPINIDSSDWFAQTAYYNDESNWQDGALYIGKHLIKVKEETEGVLNIKQGTITLATEAAYKCSLLTDIIIPESIVRIGDNAFCHCSSLTNINVPDTVVEMGDSAFQYCTALKSVNLSNKITELGMGTFYSCESLTNIVLPSELLQIDYRAFSNCSSLNSISLPDKVMKVDYAAFEGCSSLKDVKLSKGMNKIEDMMFLDCISLKSINIPDNIIEIGESAFRNCTALESVNFSSKLETIEKYAFEDCYALTSVQLPDGLKSIGSRAFAQCKLDDIYFPVSLEKIGGGVIDSTPYYNNEDNWQDDALYVGNHLLKTRSLSNVYTIKPGTKAIAGEAFYCSDISGVVIPNTVTTIGKDAFKYCYSLTDIAVPNSVTEIQSGAFYNCTSLTDIVIPNSVKIIGDDDLYTSGTFQNCTNLKNIALGSNIEYIGECTFKNCTSLTAIDIPNSVTWIDELAFMGCTSLKSVFIPDNVKAIEFRVFQDCVALENVLIGESVEYISSLAFENCTALKNITLGKSVESVYKDSFRGCISLSNIFVDENNEFYLEEDGVLFNDDLKEIVLYPQGKSDKKYIIPNGVECIKVTCFGDCEYLENVVIPSSVIEIEGSAFKNCKSIKNVVIPETVRSIGYNAFGIDSNSNKIAEFTIYGAIGSPAEDYANEYGFEFIALEKVIDQESKISVSEVNVGNISEDALLKISNIQNTDLKIVYDISLLKNDEPVQPTGEVVVKIPVPKTMDIEKCRVYRQETDGTYTDMNAVHADGYMIFTTDHFSRYILTTGNPNGLIGDVNGDGKVTAIDARWILQYTAGNRTFTDEQKVLADVNGDGKVTAIDARWILQYTAGNRTFTDEQKLLADVNGDGKITAVDARAVLKQTAGN